jgi:hypothetical protein
MITPNASVASSAVIGEWWASFTIAAWSGDGGAGVVMPKDR